MPDIGTLKRVSQSDIRILSVTQDSVRPAAIQIAHVDLPAEEYDGATEFTPSAETQTISIAGKVATTDITINPIPSNYGLITWNGGHITVS